MEIMIVSHYSKDYWKLVQLRDKVLREPLDLMFSEEELFLESSQIHMGCFEEEQAAASLSIVKLENGNLKIRQVCVHPFAQGKGLGKKLAAFSESWATENNFKILECNARETAIPFYESMGYQKVGDQFSELAIPHFKMRKEL